MTQRIITVGDGGTTSSSSSNRRRPLPMEVVSDDDLPSLSSLSSSTSTSSSLPSSPLSFSRLLMINILLFLLIQCYRQKTTMQHQPPVINNTVSKNTSLVIIMGSFRGGEYAWASLFKNVLDPNMADLALIVGEQQPKEDDNNNEITNSLIQRAKYMWTFPEYDDWADAIDLINGTRWRTTHLPWFLQRNTTGIYGGIANLTGSGAIIMMIRWFLSQQLQQNNNQLLKQYDRFVLTRADHFYQCLHNFTKLDLSDHTMWIPRGQNWGGYTDRHLVVGRDDVLNAIDIFPPLLSEPYHTDLTRLKDPEALLKYTWNKKGLKVKEFDRVMFTCCVKEDTTRWQRCTDYKVQGIPDLFLKYRPEYRQTQQNCPPITPII